MSLRPLGDKIVLKPVKSEETTASGIVLPDSAKEKPQEGIVVAVGPGREIDNVKEVMEVKEGDRILFSRYSGIEVKHDNEDFVILTQKEVLAVID